MILQYFSEYIKTEDKKPTLQCLFSWIKERIENPAICHEDKVIQAEIFLGKNVRGDYCLIGKGETGRNLVQSLYHYILGFEHLDDARKKHLDNN